MYVYISIVGKNTEIFQKIKSKGWLSVEKSFSRMQKLI